MLVAIDEPPFDRHMSPSVMLIIPTQIFSYNNNYILFFSLDDIHHYYYFTSLSIRSLHLQFYSCVCFVYGRRRRKETDNTSDAAIEAMDGKCNRKLKQSTLPIY